MLYSDLSFPTPSDRPFFYANFVQTLDGKIQVRHDPEHYWPLGSSTDRATLTWLRAQADVVIHGRTTAVQHQTVQSFQSETFQKHLQSLGKSAPHYLVISGSADESLAPFLATNQPGQSTLATTEQAVVPDAVTQVAQVVRLGADSVDITALAGWLQAQGHTKVLVEGGPSVFAQFLQQGLIDELFLTLAPKVIGNTPDSTLTLVEGVLFEPETMPVFELVSATPEGNELFLRYRRASI